MNKRSNSRKSGGKFKPSKKVIVLACIAGALLVVLLSMLAILFLRNDEPEVTEPTETTAPTTETTEPTTETTEETTETTEPTEPQMLEHMAELYAQNPDIVGWITFEGTDLDYPIMYTPDDEEKYLYKNFKQEYSFNGLPFVDKDCSIDPESDNVIIYGHNMTTTGMAFNAIMNYVDQEYYEEHPTFSYTTLYEERTYEVVAAFYDRVYYKSEDCFKFYNFVDAETEHDFLEAIAYYRANSCVDTGIEPEYGDQLMTLVTCSHHVQYGRFVLIGRLVTEDAPEVEETTAAAE